MSPLIRKETQGKGKKNTNDGGEINDIKMETKCILNENDIIEVWKRTKRLAINE